MPRLLDGAVHQRQRRRRLRSLFYRIGAASEQTAQCVADIGDLVLLLRPCFLLRKNQRPYLAHCCEDGRSETRRICKQDVAAGEARVLVMRAELRLFM